MLFEARNISFAYNGKQILDSVNLAVTAGELIVISGPSGAGKTTLLRLLNRLQDPQDGIIRLNAVPLAEYKVTELRRQIYYLQQTPVMVDGTIKQNLLLPFTFQVSQGMRPPADERLLSHLRRFELADVSLASQALDLSLGQKQRIAFIRALLIEPKVMLLDEPISALDPESRAAVAENMERLVATKEAAIIMVSHHDFGFAHVRARKFRLSAGNLEELA